MSLSIASKAMFEFQTPATLNQAAPVQNTWYTILDTTKNVRIYDIAVNVEDTNETLEVQVTIDGQTIGANDEACTHSTQYFALMKLEAISRVCEMILVSEAVHDDAFKSFVLEGKSVKVEVRKTTAAGAGNLTGIVAYGVLKSI